MQGKYTGWGTSYKPTGSKIRGNAPTKKFTKSQFMNSAIKKNMNMTYGEYESTWNKVKWKPKRVKRANPFALRSLSGRII